MAARARSRTAAGLALLAVLGAHAVVAQNTERPSVAAVESLLTVGAVGEARAAASRLARNRPNDPRVLNLLGTTLLAGPSPRLLDAIRAFREATRRSPADSAPWAGMADAALRLGGADGESIAREALERLLALNPAAPRAWEDWLTLYRSRRERERMRRSLQSFASDPRVGVRIARLLIEDERYSSADSVLDAILAADPGNTAALALRAQSAFEAAADSSGYRFYELALSHARGAPEALWSQVVGIATPQELRAWESGSADPERFLRSFWARRQVNLFEPVNGRVAEHFHRLRIARARWPLTHPLVTYQQRQGGRWLNATASAGEEVFFQRCEVRQFVGRPGRVADAARAIAMPPLVLPDRIEWRTTDWVPMPGVLSVPATARAGLFAELGRFPRTLNDMDSAAVAVGYNLRTGLDDRGLLFLRFGEPARRTIGAPNVEDPFCAIRDLEVWEYADIGAVRFFRPSAVSVYGAGEASRQTGDILLRPMNEAQFTTAALAVTRDATSVDAPLAFGAWFAQLRGEAPRSTDVVVAVNRGVIAAELVPEDGVPGAVRWSERGVAVLAAAPGRAKLVVHARDAEVLGRQALSLMVRSFGAGPAVSDLLVAHPWGDTVVTRAALVTHLSRRLTFAVGTPVRVAAEVYGLRPSGDGRVQYRVAYSVVRSNQPARELRRDSLEGATILSFDRERLSRGDATIEWLDIGTDRLRPGQYVIRLDLSANGRTVGRAQAAIALVEPER